jgi:hypothetical protein
VKAAAVASAWEDQACRVRDGVADGDADGDGGGL